MMLKGWWFNGNGYVCEEDRVEDWCCSGVIKMIVMKEVRREEPLLRVVFSFFFGLFL
jgi:hypothetical protein